MSQSGIHALLTFSGNRAIQTLHAAWSDYDDPHRGMLFCEWFEVVSEAGPEFRKKILWTDEGPFKTNERVNEQYFVHWSDKSSC